MLAFRGTIVVARQQSKNTFDCTQFSVDINFNNLTEIKQITL